MILFITLNVLKTSPQKTTLWKVHEGCQEKYLIIMIDAKSHLGKHAIRKCHKCSKIEDFNVISKGYRNTTFKRKVSESLLINDVRSTLNTHQKFVPLKLFN